MAKMVFPNSGSSVPMQFPDDQDDLRCFCELAVCDVVMYLLRNINISPRAVAAELYDGPMSSGINKHGQF